MISEDTEDWSYDAENTDLITEINYSLKYIDMEHKSSHKQHSYIYSDRQQYIVSVKIMDFSFMPKIIRILRSCSMKIFSTFPTVNISKLNFY